MNNRELLEKEDKDSHRYASTKLAAMVWDEKELNK